MSQDELESRLRGPRRRFRKAVAIGGVATMALALVACGGGGDTESEHSLDEVIEMVDGMNAEEREAKLLELAEGEGGLTWYTSLSDSDAYLEAFTEKYGIEVETYRGTVDEVRQRVIEESSADAGEADVIEINDSGIYPLVREEMLADYDASSPVLEEIPDEFHSASNWVWGMQSQYVPAWNTDEVSDPPEDWEDLLTRFAGQAGWEPRAYYWFGALLEKYFVKELGYTEEEALELFKEAAKGARAVQGNPTLFQYVQSGDLPVIMHTYASYFLHAEEAGAPIGGADTPILPIPMQPHGLAIPKDVTAPASALLWFDWWLTEGQKEVVATGTWTVNPNYASDFQKQYESDVLVIDEAYVDDIDHKWHDLYEEVLKGIGQSD